MTVVERKTRETQIRIALGSDVDTTDVDTSIPFLDHMLRTLSRYSGLPMSVTARGDLRHHISEDVAIALGNAVAAAAPESRARFGDRTIPMDDALVHVAVDVGGRAYYQGRLPSRTYEHWMRSFAQACGATLHVRVLRGRDRHHVVEAAFKALGLALRDALAQATAANGPAGVFSTKGSVDLRVQP